MVFQMYRRRLAIWESKYGRNGGWIAEYRGHSIVVLSDVRFEEMFWDSYLFEISTDNTSLRERLLTTEFWVNEISEITWRSRQFGDVVQTVFVAGNVFLPCNRILVRGLYLPIPDPWPWDKMLLGLRWGIRSCFPGR